MFWTAQLEISLKALLFIKVPCPFGLSSVLKTPGRKGGSLQDGFVVHTSVVNVPSSTKPVLCKGKIHVFQCVEYTVRDTESYISTDQTVVIR